MSNDPLTDALTVMAAEINTTTNVEQSAIQLIDSMSAYIKAHANDPAALLAFVDRLESQKMALSAAVVANTNAANGGFNIIRKQVTFNMEGKRGYQDAEGNWHPEPS